MQTNIRDNIEAMFPFTSINKNNMNLQYHIGGAVGESDDPSPSDPSTLGPGFESHGEHSTPYEVSIKFSALIAGEMIHIGICG